MTSSSQHFDLIIAGGGAAGALLGARLAFSMPQLSILLLEKESSLGGRIRATDESQLTWGSGIRSISQPLRDFMANTLRASPQSPDLSQWIQGSLETIGVYAARELHTDLVESIFAPEGAKLIAGRAGQKEWPEFAEIIEHGIEGQALEKAWTGAKKSPAMLVGHQFANLMGVSDLPVASLRSLRERAKYHAQPLHYGDFAALFAHLVEEAKATSNLQAQTHSRIVESFYKDETWHLMTEKGPVTANALAVCQAPSEALQWLERAHCPVSVLNLALKSKPVSAVTLSERLLGPCKLPDITLVPAETVQIYHFRGQELCYQVAIDYEHSLNSAAVVKAIKRLKRARKKIHQYLEDQQTKGEHIALHSLAWPLSPAWQDSKYIQPLEAMEFNKEHIFFVGDSYGLSYNPDQNLLQSLLKTSELVTKQASRPTSPQ